MKVQVRAADFVTSVPSVKTLRVFGPVEIAFAGRSNVGKSSLINTLLGRKVLARVSSKPGSTRSLDFYRISLAQPKREMIFVDLPGHGYAKVSREERSSWLGLIRGFFADDRPLAGVVLLCDPRRGPEEEELEIVQRLRSLGRTIIPVLTKVDKLRQSERSRTLTEAGKPFAPDRVTAFSSQTQEGRDELWRRILEAAFPG